MQKVIVVPDLGPMGWIRLADGTIIVSAAYISSPIPRLFPGSSSSVIRA